MDMLLMFVLDVYSYTDTQLFRPTEQHLELCPVMLVLTRTISLLPVRHVFHWR